MSATNLLLEGEAREKWCPFARIVRREETVTPTGTKDLSLVHTELVGGVNRDALGSPRGFVVNSCKCFTTGCMAWRWALDGTPRGYCGLAGQAGGSQ